MRFKKCTHLKHLLTFMTSTHTSAMEIGALLSFKHAQWKSISLQAKKGQKMGFITATDKTTQQDYFLC